MNRKTAPNLEAKQSILKKFSCVKLLYSGNCVEKRRVQVYEQENNLNQQGVVVECMSKGELVLINKNKFHMKERAFIMQEIKQLTSMVHPNLLRMNFFLSPSNYFLIYHYPFESNTGKGFKPKNLIEGILETK
mmetsp:Transcript_27437/g.26508  ORF Transcript_27437/g.26508 Transcript_27437/m.26508 type:complete len:133 (-) Transcript_27437:1162-1560(-)